MGYYIEVPQHKGKAQQIIDLHGARWSPDVPSFKDIKEDEAIICVVDNGPFEAAAFVYNEDELAEFARPDGRPKYWLIMDRAKAEELTGYGR